MVHDLLIEPLRAPFMRRAVIEVVLLGVLGGVVGVHVLLRRLSFLTEVVQHTVFPGIAIAFAFGQSLLLGALVTGIASVLLLGALVRRRRVDSDAAMAVLFAVFLAVGVVVVSRRRGFQADLTALLFGRILAVDTRQLVETAIIAVACIVAIAVVHKELVLRAFDPQGAAAMGYPLTRLDLLLDVVVALAVIAGIRAMGTVLAVALIVTPAATAQLVCRRIGPQIALAALLGALGGWLGLVIAWDASVNHDVRLAPGATLVVVLTAVFAIVAVATSVTRRVALRGSAARRAT
jgi:manganese/iron transport system permease protein